ncbi:MAG: serine/threonine-protein phosphatase [Chloroflexi bacterium]|nr:serine/threonine-protein phosphatase [Chloroflexota bacterium]
MWHFNKFMDHANGYERSAIATFGVLGIVLLLLSGFLITLWLSQLHLLSQIYALGSWYGGVLALFTLNLGIWSLLFVGRKLLPMHSLKNWKAQPLVSSGIDEMPTMPIYTDKELANSRDLSGEFPAEAFPYLHLAVKNPSHVQAKKALRADGVSHTGIVRMHRPNEDSYLHLTATRHSPRGPQAAGLFLVADGMGGHSCGQYASSMVVEAIRAAMDADLKNPQVSSEDLKNKLVQAVQDANMQLFHENKSAGILCGTTLTGVVLIEQPDIFDQRYSTYVAHVVNVGDSRTYWHSVDDGFSRITRDHSVVEEMIAHGILAPEDRYTHRDRNKIYRCIGDTLNVDVDVFTITLQTSDRLLLCSDGLWEMVHDDDLASFLALPNIEPSVITSHLLQAALNRGGKDNVTALVVMLAGERDASVAWR